MRLRLNSKLKAALIAAIATVGFTLPQTEAGTTDTTLTTTFGNCNQSATASVTTANAFGSPDVVNTPTSTISDLYLTSNPSTKVNIKNGGDAGNKADFLSPNTNVGTNTPWTLVMSYTGAGDVQSINGMTLSVGLFSGGGGWQGSQATWTGDVTFTATVTAGQNTATYTGNLFNAAGGSGKGAEPFIVTLSGEKLDLTDISDYTVTLALTETFNNGCFVGLNSIGYSVTATLPELGSYTWEGTEDSHAWGDAVWNDGAASGASFVPGSDATFNDAGWKVVDVNESVSARTVSVNATDYTFNVAADQTLTIKELTMAEAGTLTVGGEGALNVTIQLHGQGTLALGSDTAVTAASLSIAAGKTFALEGEGAELSVSTLTNEGTLSIGEGATVNYTSAEYTVGSGETFKTTGDGLLTLTTLKVAGGTLDIASDLKVTGGGDGKGGNNNSKGLHLSGDGATVNINDGTTTVTGAVYTNANNISLNVGTGATNAKLVTRRLELGDRNGGAATFHVGQHGTVVITGNEDYRSDTNNPQKNTSLQLAEWNQIVSINIEGNLYSKDATAFMSNDASSSIAINGGTMAVKGIATTSATSTRAHTLTMTGGKIVLGERGLAAEPGNWTVTLNSGEIGMYADTVVGRNANITGAVTFNTAKYVWSDNQTLAEGEEGGIMTVSANLTGTGTITKDGAGELILSGAGNALTHTLQVKAGKLTLSGSIAIDDIEDGDIEEGYVTAGGEKVSDGNGFAYKSGILNVYNVEEGAELVNNGSFTYGGEAVTVDQDGRYALSETVDHTTLWVNSGTESYDTYHTASEGALTTAKVAGGATLAIGTNAVGTLAFKENGTTINVTGTGTVNAISGTGTLNLEDNAVVTLAPQGTPSAPTLSGAGTLALAPSANVNCTITSFGEDWTGTLEINGTNGTPTLYLGSGATAEAGNLHMAAGAATIRLNGNTAKAVELDEVVMEKGTKLLSFYANYDGNDYASVNMSIGALTMKGDTATVGTTNHGGLINIGSITGSGTLTLTYESSSDAKTVLNLGGEDVEATTFHGTLDVYHNNNGNKRTTTLILNDEYTAADAVVQFRAVGAGTNSRALGIGLHADTVKVAGLNDGTIGSATGNNLYALYSGDYTGLDNRYDGGTDFYEEAGDDMWRTLEITGDGEYSTAIKVLDHVNLLMTGTGTQTFTGDMSEFNGSLTLKAGTVVVNSQLGEDAVVTVEGDATLGGDGIDATQVGIAADKTATFTQGIQDASGVTFYSDSTGVEVKNTNEAGGDALLYDISKENAKVTADRLGVDSETDVTVKNEVVVWGIANFGKGDLTLTHVDVEPLESVNAYDGALTLQNIAEVSLVEIEIASGSTVAVYKGAVADATQEGTVTITEKLKAGGGTLLANLEMANNSKLALSLEGGGMQALTLGSQFTIAEGAIVRLDDATLAALDNLAVGGSLTLIKALDQTTLGYGDNNYDGTWYDAMFSRVDGEYSLAGDFQVFADETGFGLTKVSNVPEPTTGTLSLLALAALCMRRRRK